MRKMIQKDIAEQIEIAKRRFGPQRNQDILEIVEKMEKVIRRGDKLFFVASGSSYHSCLFAKYLFSAQNDFLIEVFQAGEFEPFIGEINPSDMVVFVSQSGETADMLEIIPLIKKKATKTLAITNEHNSSLRRKSRYHLFIEAGRERAIPATKTYTAEMMLFLEISDLFGDKHHRIQKWREKIVLAIEDVLSQGYKAELKKFAQEFFNFDKVFVLGEEENLANAYESALKLKEISGISAEGFSTSEFLHGPITLINKNTLTIIFNSQNSLSETEKIIGKIVDQKGKVLNIGTIKSSKAHRNFIVNELGPFSAVVSIIVLQNLALFWAEKKKRDPDHPKGLRKEVV